MDNLIFIFFFLPIFLIIYYLTPSKYKNIILLLFSLLFIIVYDYNFAIILLISLFINYLMLNYLKKNNSKKNIIILLTLLFNIIYFVIFKIDFMHINIKCQIGLTIYTISIISYDVFYYKNKKSNNFINYFTYFLMFPKIIYGPFAKYEELMDDNKKITFDKLSDGVLKFIRGLFKKVFLANGIGYLYYIVNTTSQSNMTVLLSWLGVISYTLAIYYTLSGYSDMAVGIGKMIGFKYSDNYNYPFCSRSLTEFINKWNITIVTWFKDSIIIKLKFNIILKTILFGILIALFYKWSSSFIVLGVFISIILILEKFFLKKYLDKHIILSHIYTLLMVLISFTLITSNNILESLLYLKNMFCLSKIDFINNYFIYYFKNYFVLIIIGILLLTGIYSKIKEKLINFKYKKAVFLCTMIIYIIMFILIISYLVGNNYNFLLNI